MPSNRPEASSVASIASATSGGAMLSTDTPTSEIRPVTCLSGSGPEQQTASSMPMLPSPSLPATLRRRVVVASQSRSKLRSVSSDFPPALTTGALTATRPVVVRGASPVANGPSGHKPLPASSEAGPVTVRSTLPMSRSPVVMAPATVLALPLVASFRLPVNGASPDVPVMSSNCTSDGPLKSTRAEAASAGSDMPPAPSQSASADGSASLALMVPLPL
ncbi:MAG: hypothetical protein ABS47_02815 [Devosia sp. SCN 66-27]|nr:MAG: hypothetical protein ABS47_02815 [Devosia sp. SCN 66-27]